MGTRLQKVTANRVLLDTNIGWLRQAQLLVEQLNDDSFLCSPKGLAPHRVGSHLRHVLEFYECFLDGIQYSLIDYDARRRDESIERSRHQAAERIGSILRRLEDDPLVQMDSIVLVRMEDAEAGKPQNLHLTSSVSRELQALSSHTIHHFALIAVTLRALGLEVDPDFGMSPSTLRYQAEMALASAAEAA